MPSERDCPFAASLSRRIFPGCPCAGLTSPCRRISRCASSARRGLCSRLRWPRRPLLIGFADAGGRFFALPSINTRLGRGRDRSAVGWPLPSTRAGCDRVRALPSQRGRARRTRRTGRGGSISKHPVDAVRPLRGVPRCHAAPSRDFPVILATSPSNWERPSGSRIARGLDHSLVHRPATAALAPNRRGTSGNYAPSTRRDLAGPADPLHARGEKWRFDLMPVVAPMSMPTRRLGCYSAVVPA